MFDGLPEVGTKVLLAMGSGAMYPTTVDDDFDGELLLGAPAVAADDLPAVGDQFELRWFSARGRHHVQVRLTSVTSTGYLAWFVEAAARPQVRQDRRYVRAGGGEPVTFTRTSDDGAAHAIVRAAVVDLSERALRASTSALDMRAEERVTVGLTLAGSSMVVPGQVHRTLSGRAPETVEVVVMLEVTERQADLIRQYVFAAQRRERLRAVGS